MADWIDDIASAWCGHRKFADVLNGKRIDQTCSLVVTFYLS